MTLETKLHALKTKRGIKHQKNRILGEILEF